VARELTIRIEIENSAQARAALANVEQGLQGVEKAGGQVTKAVGTPTKADTVVGGLTAMRTAVAGLGLGLAVSKTVEYASALSDLSAKSGISVEGLQRLNIASSQVGLTMNDAVTGINQFQRRLADDDKSAVAAVKKLGLSVDELRALRPDEAFVRIATAISEIPNQGDRMLAAYDLMGKGGEKLVPLILNADLLKDSHITMSKEAIEGLDRLDDMWEVVKLNVLSALGVVLGEIVDTWTIKVPRIWAVAKFAVNELVTSLLVAFVRIVTGVQALYRDVKLWLVDRFTQFVIDPVKALYAGFVTAVLHGKDLIVGYAKALYEGVKAWLVDSFTTIVSGVKGKIDAVTGFFRDMYDKVVGNSYVPDMIVRIGQEFSRLETVMVHPTQVAAGNVTGTFATMSTTSLSSIAGLVSSATGMLTGLHGNARSQVDSVMGFVRGLNQFLPTQVAQAITEIGRIVPIVMAAWDLADAFLSWLGDGNARRDSQQNPPEHNRDNPYGPGNGPDDGYNPDRGAGDGDNGVNMRMLRGLALPATSPRTRGGGTPAGDLALRSEVAGLRRDNRALLMAFEGLSRELTTSLPLAMRNALLTPGVRRL
jgi:hypothetical protein